MSEKYPRLAGSKRSDKEKDVGKIENHFQPEAAGIAVARNESNCVRIKIEAVVELPTIGDFGGVPTGTNGTEIGSVEGDTSSADDERGLGYTPDPDQEPSLFEREMIAQSHYEDDVRSTPAAAIPSTIDLRNFEGEDYITKVVSQGSCGSCVAFGVVATIEATARLQKKAPDLTIDLSEAHLFFCHGGKNGRTCGNVVDGVEERKGGWWPGGALKEVQASGIVAETCFPYPTREDLPRGSPTPGCPAQPQSPCKNWTADATKIKTWGILSHPTDMKSYLASGNGALVACYTVYEDFKPFFRKNPTGIYRRRQQSGKVTGGHCICVVGYNNSEGSGYWICKNSWGSTWGDEGYFKIGYGEVGIDAYMWFVELV